MTSPDFTFRSLTCFSLGRISTASQVVRTSMANCSRNSFSLATNKLDSFSMTRPT
jgi:hypothetical protein